MYVNLGLMQTVNPHFSKCSQMYVFGAINCYVYICSYVRICTICKKYVYVKLRMLSAMNINTYIAKKYVLLTKEYINNWTFDVRSKVCGEVTHFLPSPYALQ